MGIGGKNIAVAVRCILGAQTDDNGKGQPDAGRAAGYRVVFAFLVQNMGACRLRSIDLRTEPACQLFTQPASVSADYFSISKSDTGIRFFRARMHHTR